MRRLCLLLAFWGPVLAQDLENFRFEITTGGWLLTPAGNIQAGPNPIDLKADLGIPDPSTQFTGRLVVKPSRRNRLFIEGTPYRLNGDNEINREFVYGGRRFTVRDRIVSEARMDYVFGGYQFDFVSRPRGHAGLLGGIGWIDATGTLRSTTPSASAVESASLPLPLAGAEFRVFPIGGRYPVSLGAEVKGMSLGDFGHYVQAAVNVGLGFSRYVTMQAGYGVVDADVHKRDRSVVVAPSFHGPMFSLQLRR